MGGGAYDAFLTYALVYMATGAAMRCNQGKGSACSEIGAEKIAEAYNGLWKEDDYDPRRKDDAGFTLRLLYKRGKGELAGRRLGAWA
jgi:hypothetical protein